MADIFLSYARDDLATAGELARHLEEKGWSVWYDADIPAGASWRMQIQTELTAARAVVVLWSKRSVTRHWVHEEAVAALEAGKLLQGLLEPDVQIPFGYTTLQAARLWDWRGEDTHDALSRLRDAISAKVKPAATPAPESAPALPTEPARPPASEFAHQPERAREPAPEPEAYVQPPPLSRQAPHVSARSAAAERRERFVDLSALHWTGYPVMAVFIAAVGIVGAGLAARYLFNAPLMGLDTELAPLLVGLCAIFGSVLAASRGELVTAPASIRIMRGQWLGNVKTWLNAWLGAATSGVAAYALWNNAVRQTNLGGSTMLLQLPQAPFTFALAIGAAMIAAVLLWRLYQPRTGARA